MTTLADIAFIRVALRKQRIEPEHLRRAYVHLRSGRSRRSIPQLLHKNKLAEKALLEEVLREVDVEIPEVNDDLRLPEQPDQLVRRIAENPESSKIAGLRVGLCVLKECVGVGGDACVFKAHHLAFGHDVVIKILRPESNRKASGLERLRKEAELTSRLQHAGIARVFDFDVSGPLPYVVFEHIEGESLKDRINRFQRLTAEEVVALGRQVALGLHAAHEAGLLHRDIKPSNIMVSTAGRVTIIDFGFARDLSVPGHITATGFIIGTPYFTAPEYGTKEKVDRRADLYSLGVTLYFALTGTLPFKSRSVVRLLAMHMQEAAPPVRERAPETPAGLAAIIDRLLKKSPADRFKDGAAVAEALGQAEALEESSPAAAWGQIASKQSLDIAEAPEAAPDPETPPEPRRPTIEPKRCPQYDFLPQGLLETFIADDEISDPELPRRRFFYPGCPASDDGLEVEAALTDSKPKARTRDALPVSDDELPANFRKQAEPPAYKNLDEALTAGSPLELLPIGDGRKDEKGKPPKPKVPSRSKRLGRRTSKRTAAAKSSRRSPAPPPPPKDNRVYCAACEEPIKKAKKILGNIVCLDCSARVKAHELCTACFGSLGDERELRAVFRSGAYCAPCAKRVILFCAHCRDRFPLVDIAEGAAHEIGGKPYCHQCSREYKGEDEGPDEAPPEGEAKTSQRSVRSSRRITRSRSRRRKL